ncbi:hypothetical protein QE152_g33442 [Popillia japonica]|uniref:Uncharacterized protein n=1 Tax=Popillia japonica TaxID=7064 RepID=A0AAW1IX60_POPJA
MSAHSPGANCEEDDCEGALHSLQRYIYEVPEEDDISSADILDDEESSYYTLSQISDTAVINSHGYMYSRARKYLTQKELQELANTIWDDDEKEELVDFTDESEGEEEEIQQVNHESEPTNQLTKILNTT